MIPQIFDTTEVVRDKFGNILHTGDYVIYPFRHWGSRSYDTNVAKIVNVRRHRSGMKYVTTKIVSRNKEWGTIVNGRLAGTVYSKGTPLEFQFDVYTASVGGKDGTYSV
jgi:hypothetical protein